MASERNRYGRIETQSAGSQIEQHGADPPSRPWPPSACPNFFGPGACHQTVGELSLPEASG